MTGSEHSLDVYLGNQIIATITLIDDQLRWHYQATWQISGFAISPHLPLQGDIPPLNVQRFLRNLLPEGNALDELIHCFHLSKHNTFGLISALGLDTPGSLAMLPHKQPFPQKGFFRKISDTELTQRINARNETSLIIWDNKPRLSVAGVQDKINVMLNLEAKLGFGEGKLCSTHILKFEKQTLSHLVLNEYLSMQLAKYCGLEVANVKLIRFGKHSTLLVERFDRQFISMNEIKRRHIIDSCQALNLAPDYKYERNFGSSRDVAHIRDGVNFPKLFDFANQCTNPALTKQQMLDWVLFNLLIFNYDAHGKNISFFVGANGITLAPFYDLVNIKSYPDFEHNMAMGLGDEFDGETINAYQLADFADSCQLSRSFVTKRLQSLIISITTFFNDSSIKIVNDADEKRFLQKYKTIVQQRCEHLLNQCDEMIVIEL